MKKVLFLENLPYKSHITVGSHHYARLFGETCEVLWMSLPWHIFQLMKDRKSDRYANWNRNRPQKMGGNITCFTPFIPIPYRNFPLLDRQGFVENLYSFMPGIVGMIKKAGFMSPDIAWFTDPRHISVLKYVNPTYKIYRCVDNLEHFNDVPPSLLEVEKNLVKEVDTVFYTSMQLKNKFEGLNEHSFYLPNGCDYDFFSSKKPDGNIFDRDKLNILYAGAVAEWIDFDAVLQLSEIENATVHLVGPVRTNIPKAVANKENIHVVGPKPYEMMPAYMHSADVGVIPFKINEITDYVNPIKLYEYCACGLQTITSAFKTVADISGPFYTYGDRNQLEGIVRNITTSCGEAKKFTSSDLISFGRENSWRSRFELVQSLLHKN